MAASPALLKYIPAGRRFDFSRDLIPRLIAEKKPVGFFSGATYVLASDTPESYRRTCRIAAKRKEMFGE
jgi:NDP-sugar pyrophosphorylase family protein